MAEKRMAYFEATGEILLGFMKQISVGIPENAELMKIEPVPPRYSPLNEPMNIMRFIITSDEFFPSQEGAQIPRIDPIINKPQ